VIEPLEGVFFSQPAEVCSPARWVGNSRMCCDPRLRENPPSRFCPRSPSPPTDNIINLALAPARKPPFGAVEIDVAGCKLLCLSWCPRAPTVRHMSDDPRTASACVLAFFACRRCPCGAVRPLPKQKTCPGKKVNSALTPPASPFFLAAAWAPWTGSCSRKKIRSSLHSLRHSPFCPSDQRSSAFSVAKARRTKANWMYSIGPSPPIKSPSYGHQRCARLCPLRNGFSPRKDSFLSLWWPPTPAEAADAR